MTPRHRAILRAVAHHGAKAAAIAFGITDRQVRRIIRDAMDRYGCRTEYELFRLVERRERRSYCDMVPLW